MNQKKKKEFIHVSDWIDTPSIRKTSDNDGDVSYAKFVLMNKLIPAHLAFEFKRFLDDKLLFCTYGNERYRCTGASRMGDVWLTKNFNQDTGYHLRVNVAECNQWSDKSEFCKG